MTFIRRFLRSIHLTFEEIDSEAFRRISRPPAGVAEILGIQCSEQISAAYEQAASFQHLIHDLVRGIQGRCQAYSCLNAPGWYEQLKMSFTEH